MVKRPRQHTRSLQGDSIHEENRWVRLERSGEWFARHRSDLPRRSVAAQSHAIRERIERSFFERMPGYTLIRSLTQRVAGKEEEEKVWKPALAEIEDALVPAFIIEELEDGRLTVFVPSVPTPFAGAVYILNPQRVHPLDIPFTQALKPISRWGSGSKELVAAMKTRNRPISGL